MHALHLTNYSKVQVPSLLLFFSRLGTYSSKLKIAKITPVFKSEYDTDTNNYRPISLLSNFNRVLEKIIRQAIERNTNFCIPHNTAFVGGIQPNTQYWTLLMIYRQTWINDCYLVEYSLISKNSSTPSVTTFCLISSITMAFVD